MEINSYCLSGWERNEVSYYLETQILKKILPCAMPGAMRLSLTRFVLMDHQKFKLLNGIKEPNWIVLELTDHFFDLYKYEELFSCLNL